MQQMIQSGSQNQFQPKKLHYLAILDNMLKQNTNHQTIKQKIKKKIQKTQTLTYSSLVQSQDKYLQKIGLHTQDQQLYIYIGKLMNSRQSNFFNQYHRGLFNIKSTIKPPPQPQPQPPQQLVKQVQYVLSNVDLPLSLFKRNDNYWSIDNPKTLQAKQYLKRMHEQDQKFKQQVRKKRSQIIKQKQQQRNKTIDVIKKQQQVNKKQMKQKIVKKIQQLKKNDQNRKKAISQSVEFIRQKGVPLYKKIQRQFKQKVQLPSLQQKKRKLSQIRQIMRSVPLQQIHEHKQRYQKLKSQHQGKNIKNQPLNISYKSHFYEQIKSISLSKFNEYNSNLSMYQKRLQYSRMVKQNHKPLIDQIKKDQLQSRIKLMNKRRARKKIIKKQTKNSQDSQQQQQPQQQQQQEQQQQPQPQQQQYDSDNPKPSKDDQYQPSQKQRYKMGLNYLKIAKKLADKKNIDTIKSTNKPPLSNRINTATQNNTIHFGDTIDNKQGQQTVQPKQKKQKFVWVSKYDQQQKKQQRIKYKNYLKQISKGNQSTDLMDTSQIKKQIQRSLAPSTQRQKAKSRYQKNRRTPDIQAQIMYHTNLQNKIRNIEERAKNQQQLLKFKRVNKSQKIKKKMAIDDAVVDTIKARLLMMNKTLDV